MEFFETAQGQILGGAIRYLTAARALRSSESWKDVPGLIQAPTLHLLAHGIELLLKYPLLSAGIKQEDVRKDFGHRLVDLWQHKLNEHVRNLCNERAVAAWNEARTSGAWPNDEFDKDPKDELSEALKSLDWLHGRESDFALRYVLKGRTLAPRPAFLIDVFWNVAERGAKNPVILTEAW